eukprot:7010571-Prymnesium_polylepis.1
MPLRKGVARLMPQPPGPDGGHRTAVEGLVVVELEKLLFLGPARFIAPPSWLLRIVVRILVPYIWHQYLAILATLGDEESTFAARVRADVTGLYAFLQVPRSA